MEADKIFADIQFIQSVEEDKTYVVARLGCMRHIGSGPRFADQNTEGISRHVTCVCTRN
jgi:hypothetical protein